MSPTRRRAAGADELYRIAVDLSPSGMLAVDAGGAILLVNREIERLFGYARDELIGKPVETLVPARFAGQHPADRDVFFAHPAARRMGAGRDLYGVRKDGSEVPVEIGLNPVRTREGVVVLASVVDITARRQAEEQLRQSQKMEAIGTLAGGIAHDFNNLLLAIMGHAELAEGSAGDNAELRGDLEQIQRAAERGRQLVKRILAFSRQRGLARASMQVEPTAREALQLLRSSLPSTIEIREHVEDGTPPVLSDETLVHQVLMNLATNAAHAMPEGGTLSVWIGPAVVDEQAAAAHPGLAPGRYARLSVSDTGHGMTPEVQRRAFEPFFTTKPVGAGTGLGLSIIHGLVRNHGGTVELDSEPGKGTRVDVYLPAHETAPAEDAETRAAAPAAAAPPHVLLVEDEAPLAEMLRRQVTGLGLQVTVHTSSTDALEDFRSRPGAFQMMITDNTMPRMTGLALSREVLRMRPDLPILMISGLAQTADPEDLRQKGIRRLLPKPHTGAELRQAIRELLG